MARRSGILASLLVLAAAPACQSESGAKASGSHGDAGMEGGGATCGDPGVLCYEFGPIDVPPGSEWQGFQAFDVGNSEDLAIVGIEVNQVGTTSHHFTVALWTGAGAPPSEGPYQLETPDGLKFVESTLGNALVGSVFKYVKIDTGSYVGVTLPAHAYLVNNGHYLNTSTAETAVGRTHVMIRTVPKDRVRFATVNVLPGTNDINVPPAESRTVGAEWAPPTDVAVLLLTSHMHQHGRLFEAWKSVGGVETKIYSTTSYESPPLRIFATKEEPPIVLRQAAGDHLRFECTHQNDDLSVPLTYGVSARTNEMCILPLYYVADPDALLSLIDQAEGGTGFSWEYVPNGAQ